MSAHLILKYRSCNYLNTTHLLSGIKRYLFLNYKEPADRFIKPNVIVRHCHVTTELPPAKRNLYKTEPILDLRDRIDLNFWAGVKKFKEATILSKLSIARTSSNS